MFSRGETRITSNMCFRGSKYISMTGTFLRVAPYSRTVTVRNSAAVLNINLASLMYPKRIFGLWVVTVLFTTIFVVLLCLCKLRENCS